ncbi:MAG TPA: site-specific integrase [Solirubrobacterales bacterium]|nr:site-specific integrase [Solirubrobacterales bacterium]
MAATMEKTKTPGVYKRGNRYVATWRHRGKQCKSFHRTYAEAREAKAQRAAGDKRPVSKIRFGTYFPDWIETYAGRTSRGFSESTRPEYRRPIEKHALPRWESWWLGDVEPMDVRDLFGAMRKDGCTTSEIQKTKAALSALFATAVDDGLIRSNPVAGVRIPAALEDEDPEEETAKALTRAALAMLLAETPEDWRLFFEFLTHTGLRISEMVGLRWEHLDLGEKPMVRVREQFYKGRRKKLKSESGRRDVPLSPGMAAKLLAHRRDSYGGPRTPVFASKAGTELQPANVYRRVLAPAAIAVGLYVEVEDEKGQTRKRSAVSFHTFRHTCASLLFARGRNPKQVQKWLGHADPGFTLRTYVHLLDEGVGDAGFMDGEVGATPSGLAVAA